MRLANKDISTERILRNIGAGLLLSASLVTAGLVYYVEQLEISVDNFTVSIYRDWRETNLPLTNKINVPYINIASWIPTTACDSNGKFNESRFVIDTLGNISHDSFNNITCTENQIVVNYVRLLP